MHSINRRGIDKAIYDIIKLHPSFDPNKPNDFYELVIDEVKARFLQYLKENGKEDK